jgi:hypothetical protein
MYFATTYYILEILLIQEILDVEPRREPGRSELPGIGRQRVHPRITGHLEAVVEVGTLARGEDARPPRLRPCQRPPRNR